MTTDETTGETTDETTDETTIPADQPTGQPGIARVPLAEALTGFAEVWDAYTCLDIGEHLTCTEAVVFVALLDSLGLGRQARDLFDGHADGDEEGADHYGMGQGDAADRHDPDDVADLVAHDAAVNLLT